jgi:hypothetical protein
MIAAALVLSSNGYGEENCSPEKAKAIMAYLEVNSIDEMMNQMIMEILKQIPEEGREVFLAIWKNVFDKNELKSVMSNTMCQTFSLEEINALTAFYASPEGKSVMKKMPKYMAELMPYIQTLNQRAIQSAIEEFQKRKGEEGKTPRKL